VAGRPGGEGGVAHSGRPATTSRVIDPFWVRGTPGILAGRGPPGGTNRGVVLPWREFAGTSEESGDTLSVGRVDLKAFVSLSSSVPVWRIPHV
jgi:hypothetical protein